MPRRVAIDKSLTLDGEGAANTLTSWTANASIELQGAIAATGPQIHNGTVTLAAGGAPGTPPQILKAIPPVLMETEVVAVDGVNLCAPIHGLGHRGLIGEGSPLNFQLGK